jgi:hypothetical protein
MMKSITTIFDERVVKKSLIFIGGGFLGILIGKFLEKDRVMTEKYLTTHHIDH